MLLTLAGWSSPESEKALGMREERAWRRHRAVRCRRRHGAEGERRAGPQSTLRAKPPCARPPE